MKKLLLSMVALMGISMFASAETYTFKMADYLGNATKDITEWTMGGFKFVAAKGETSSTNPAFNKGGDVRLYAANTLTVTANGANITSMSFAISTQGKARFPEVTCEPGQIAEQGADPLVWNGNAASVVFTVGEQADYGTDGASKKGQFDFTSVTITTNGPVTDLGGGSGTTEPVVSNMGIYQKVTALSAGDFLFYANDSIATPQGEAKTYGYLYAEGAVVTNNQITAKKANAFTLVAVSGGYNIKDSYGRYLYMNGDFNSFQLSKDIEDGLEDSYIWIASMNADGTVVFVNAMNEKSIQFSPEYHSYGSYPDVRGIYPTLFKYVKDAEGTTEPEQPKPTYIFSPVATFAAGTYALRFGDNVMTAIAENNTYGYPYVEAPTFVGNNIETTLTNGFVFVAVDGGYTMQDVYGRYYFLKDDYNSFNLSDTADLSSTEEGYVYSVTVQADGTALIVNNLKNKTMQFSSQHNSVGIYPEVDLENRTLPTLYVLSGAGVADVDADINAPVVYYNLQGVKVANPEAGKVYIRVQGGKATKTLKK